MSKSRASDRWPWIFQLCPSLVARLNRMNNGGPRHLTTDTDLFSFDIKHREDREWEKKVTTLWPESRKYWFKLPGKWQRGKKEWWKRSKNQWWYIHSCLWRVSQSRWILLLTLSRQLQQRQPASGTKLFMNLFTQCVQVWSHQKAHWKQQLSGLQSERPRFDCRIFITCCFSVS